MSDYFKTTRWYKKELIARYLKETAMNDAENMASVSAIPLPAAPYPTSHRQLVIPKAVGSFSIIPGKDNIKTPTEKKKSNVPRELLNLIEGINYTAGPSRDVKSSTAADTFSRTLKRSERVSTKQQTPTRPVGVQTRKTVSNIAVQVKEEPHDSHPETPKRGLAERPSYKELRRESMKYREIMMAEFEKTEKAEKEQSSKSEKRKKMEDKTDESQPMKHDSMILNMKRMPETSEECNVATTGESAEYPITCNDDSIILYDPTASDPLAINDLPASGATSPMDERPRRKTPKRHRSS